MRPRLGKRDLPGPRTGGSATNDLSLSQMELVERIGWLIKLRWLAFVGVTATILVSRAAFTSQLPWGRLLATAAAIPAYNLVCYLLWNRANRAGAQHIERTSSRLANAQISLDLLVLGALIHFSGGVENLFGFYFVFHMVIASILLSIWAAFAQATLALAIFAAVVLGEYWGWLPHYNSPIGVEFPGQHTSAITVLAALWVMATSLYVTVYFATSIAARLRWRESQVVHLSQEVQRHSDELQEAYDKLAATERAKAAYTRKVAHELRSPLGAIENLLRVVADGLRGEVPEPVRETIAQARRRVHALLEVAGDLLSLAAAREARHASEWMEIDVRSMLEGVVSLLAPHAEARGVAVSISVCADLACLRCDREGMEQLLTNLVSNAVKYSHPGGTVEASVSCLGENVKIEVSDSGIGIDRQDLARIFDEFFRSGAAREFAPEGTGLGLSIVKSIVDAHGGRIEVESRKDAGTKFTVYLPRA